MVAFFRTVSRTNFNDGTVLSREPEPLAPKVLKAELARAEILVLVEPETITTSMLATELPLALLVVEPDPPRDPNVPAKLAVSTGSL